jgi:hypothetical protein
VILFIANFFLNLVSFYLYKIVYLKDSEFRLWLKQEDTNRIANTMIRIVSLLISHKFSKIIYSRFFGFSFYKAKLTSIEKLKSQNILTALSLLFISVPFAALIGSIAFYNRHST